jgi:hypothetical protein
VRPRYSRASRFVDRLSDRAIECESHLDIRPKGPSAGVTSTACLNGTSRPKKHEGHDVAAAHAQGL